MMDDRAKGVEILRAFCAEHPSWALFDERDGALLDVRVGKRLAVPLRELTAVLLRTDSRSGCPYLLVELGDGREFAVTESGIAFAPVAPAVPQAPALPDVCCLADFATLRAQLVHQRVAHPEEGPARGAVDLVMVAVGILDGARRIGFDVGDEERALDELLARMEQRGAGRP